MIKIFISLIIIMFSVTSCSLTMSDTEKKEYQLIKDRNKFISKHPYSMEFKIKNSSHAISTMLLDAQTTFLYSINISEASQILAIEIINNDEWNIHRLMVPKKEYFWDQLNSEVLLPMTIPYIYTINNEIKFKLNIYILTHLNQVIKKEKTISFISKPLKDNGENYKSFNYSESLLDQNIDPFIKAELIKEIQQVDLNRVNYRLKEKINKLKDSL